MSESTGKIKGIPYGISNYEKIVLENYYYVDKTEYLEEIENTGNYPFFIRPRRFGKSLFLSMMEAYYDVHYKDRFEELFRGTAVYDNPTPEQGKYLVLNFNFSLVNPVPGKVEDSFTHYVRGVAESFILKYRDYFSDQGEDYLNTIKKSPTASDILISLIRMCRDSNQQVYAFIDEYDNFANTILSTSGEDAYWDITHGEGFFRAFFNALKGGTGGMGAPFSRLFLTGVSPVTLDDVTSGYNIGENISVFSRFNRMLGFTRGDVEAMLSYYEGAGVLRQDREVLTGILTQWYNNYRFCEDDEEALYNSDMVLYFMKQCINTPTIPRELVDRNVRVDYGKLRHLIVVDKKGKKGTNGNFSRLREIVEAGEITSKISTGFPLEEMHSEANFISLLFYFGLLTIEGVKEGLPLLKIPNQTVKTLFYDYIVRVSQDIDLLDINTGKLDTLLHGMAYHGDWRAFFDFFSQRMKSSTSIRDFFNAEKAIQGFLLAYLGISDYFIVYSEKELNKGYADIVMEPFLARYEGIGYSYLVEIKYFPVPKTKDAKATDRTVERLKEEAEAQLARYAGDERFNRTIGKTKLIKLVLVFCGSELRFAGETEKGE